MFCIDSEDEFEENLYDVVSFPKNYHLRLANLI